MYNHRLFLIKNELKQRYEEIINFPSEIYAQEFDEFLEVIAQYVHYILNTKETSEFFMELTEFESKLVKSKKVEEINVECANIIKNIGNIILNSSQWKNYLDSNDGYSDKRRNIFINSLDHEKEQLSTAKFIENLAQYDKYYGNSTSKIETIINILNEISSELYKTDDKLFSIIEPLLDNLIIDKLKTFEKLFKFDPKYYGSDAALKLLEVYTSLYPESYKVITSKEARAGAELLDMLRCAFSRQLFSPIDKNTIQEYKKSARKIYYAISNRLDNILTKRTVIYRFKEYCEWFKREQIAEMINKDKKNYKRKNYEKQLHNFVNEFLFQSGYFPIVRFKMGRSEPDTLSYPSFPSDITSESAFVIEVKQYIGKKITESKLKKDISQTKEYLSEVKALAPNVGDDAYLLIFYNKDVRYQIQYEPSSDIYPIDIVFIYVGEKSTSEIKKVEVLKL